MNVAAQRRWAAVAAAVVIAALGVGIGAVAAPAVATLRSGGGGRLPTGTVAIVTLAVFDRPQQKSDRPAAALTGRLPKDSFRRIATIASGDTTLYAANDSAGNICLVSVRDEVQAACATPAAFARSGVSMRWSLVVISVNPTIDSGYRLAHFVASWAPDGRVRARSTRG